MTLQAGEILAFLGMVVLLLSNIGRRRARQGQLAKGRLVQMLAWGDFVAFGLILVGLVVMYLQK